MIRDFTSLATILTLALSVVVFAVIDVVFYAMVKRKIPRIFVIVVEALTVLSWLFYLDLLMYILLGVLLAGVLVSCFTNMSEVRVFTANVMKGKANFDLFHHTPKVQPEAIYDREEVFKKVDTAIRTLSKQKIGALITFEKNDDLTDIMKNGTILNAPVSAELLQTIFYPGTRLHDGAVIIRGDKIVAASVYFTPTNRPLTGKYGSRHRAAYGISETTDSVTIVVSEETGRISIAFQGELTPVAPDELLRIFEEDMATVSETSEDNAQ